MVCRNRKDGLRLYGAYHKFEIENRSGTEPDAVIKIYISSDNKGYELKDTYVSDGLKHFSTIIEQRGLITFR